MMMQFDPDEDHQVLNSSANMFNQLPSNCILTPPDLDPAS